MPHVPVEEDLETSTILLSVLFVLVSSWVLYVLIRACIRKRKERQETVFQKSPVVVTSTTHTAPGGYPVTQVPPGGYQNNALYAAPYPRQANVTVQMPMPNQGYPNPGMPPYPTTHYQMPTASGTTVVSSGAGAGAANMNPPPYDVAVATGGGQPTYEKQAAYNPSYPQQ